MAVHKVGGKNTASLRSENNISNIDYSKIDFLPKNQVLGVWIDEIMPQEEVTASGIILQKKLDTKTARWLYVVKSNVSEVKPGQLVLPVDVVAPYGAVFEEVEHWSCKAEDLTMVADSYNDTLGYVEV